MAVNPVHYAAEPAECESAHGDWHGPGWYFWIETWADRFGPYPTKEAAHKACAEYADYLMNGPRAK